VDQEKGKAYFFVYPSSHCGLAITFSSKSMLALPLVPLQAYEGILAGLQG